MANEAIGAPVERLQVTIGIIEQYPSVGALVYRQDPASGERTAVGFIVPEEKESDLDPYVLVFAETGRAVVLWRTEDDSVADGHWATFMELVEPGTQHLTYVGKADQAATEEAILAMLLPHTQDHIDNVSDESDALTIGQTMEHTDVALSHLTEDIYELRRTAEESPHEDDEEAAAEYSWELPIDSDDDDDEAAKAAAAERLQAMYESYELLGDMAARIITAAGMNKP